MLLTVFFMVTAARMAALAAIDDALNVGDNSFQLSLSMLYMSSYMILVFAFVYVPYMLLHVFFLVLFDCLRSSS